MKKPIKKCYNCAHRGGMFKIQNATHHHCKLLTDINNPDYSAWDSLMPVFGTCGDFVAKSVENTVSE